MKIKIQAAALLMMSFGLASAYGAPSATNGKSVLSNRCTVCHSGDPQLDSQGRPLPGKFGVATDLKTLVKLKLIKLNPIDASSFLKRLGPTGNMPLIPPKLTAAELADVKLFIKTEASRLHLVQVADSGTDPRSSGRQGHGADGPVVVSPDPNGVGPGDGASGDAH